MNQLIEDQRQLLLANYHDAVVLQLRAQDQVDAATDLTEKLQAIQEQVNVMWSMQLKYDVIQKQVDAAWDQLQKFNNNNPPQGGSQ